MAMATAMVTAKKRVKNNMSKMGLTDLHTHILPGVDDGAQDLEEALKMLCLQKTSGVERVALTPHFYPLREDLGAFLQKRQQAYELLLSGWDDATMPQLRLGAEVHYSPCLADMELEKLTLEGTHYLLLELTDTVQPALIEPVLRYVRDQGVTPILAHVERCVYFAEKPERLLHLLELGALAQISLRRLPGKKTQKFANICLKKNVAQIIASDIHTVGDGKFALGELLEGMGEETVIRAENFARAVWDDAQMPLFEPMPIRKKLFGYT